jgi:hypothetical protein
MRTSTLRRSAAFLAFAGLLATMSLAARAPVNALPALASSTTYYFHGTAADQANKANPPGTATFNTTAPTGTVPVTQTASPFANRDFAGNPLAAYWYGPFSSGSLSGQDIQLSWYWSSSNAEAVLLGLDMDMTIFGDPNFSTNTGTILGRATVHLNVGATPTVNTSLVPVSGSVTSKLLIQAVPHFADTGQGALVYYDATSTQSSFTFITVPPGPAVVFDASTKIAFAPATIVSPSFLGGEPEVTMERKIAGSQDGRLDNNRIFVDWPLSSRTQTSQVSRSINGGDKFRLLLDLNLCPQRNRPNCQTGGGGDSKTDVNLYNGNLYFADQEVLVNEAVASSTDHGDSWPLARQFAITNAATAVDRQWLAYIDPTVATVGASHVEAFLAYHVPLFGQFIQGIDQNGLPIPQPAPQITIVNQSGSLRVDNSSGPAHGWIYQPYRGSAGVMVGTAFAGGSPAGYINPANWHPSNVVSTDTAAIFPWLQIDSHGNAYVVWVNNSTGRLFLSVSPIDDARNNPAVHGWPGTFWTDKADITPPGVGSTVFPEVAAGDTGRIAVTFMGSTDCTGHSDNCPNSSHWNTYVDVISDALALARGTPMSVASGIVNHRVDHLGQVCTSGTTCMADRSLLDMMDIGFDASGRVGVVFMDNHNKLGEPAMGSKNGPFAHYAKETLGPALLANKPAINIAIPQNSRADTAGDATWPNTAAGRNLPSLDFLGASIGLSADGSQLVAKLRLSDASLAGMQRDLNAYNASTTQPGARLQYVARFMTGENVYHMDMDFQPGRTPQVRFFGGLLDGDDAVGNGTGATVGARYVADAGFNVTGSVRDGVITLMAPKTLFGVNTGSSLFSVTGFSMAGPSEQDTSATLVANSMRTIDATPPFDATLQTVQNPPGGETCDDQSIRKHHGWHDVPDDRAENGSQCREVHNGGSGDDMEMDFFGTGADIIIARGPRGGNFTMSIDGGALVLVNEYRPPTNPSSPDGTGRIDLDFNIPVHIDAPAPGYHTLRIDVLNNSSDPLRNMIYVDGFRIYGGEGVGAPTTATDVSTLVNGTLAALLGAEFVVMTTANTVDLNFVLEAVPGTTLTIKDPAGNVVASGTVQDGVLALHFGPNNVGAYTVDVRNTTAGQIAFSLWEVVGGN